MTQTPWGKSDSSEQITRGIMRYTTPSHGGYHLSPKLNALVNPAWQTDGWYEEDLGWSIVMLTFPGFFSAKEVEDAHTTARAWFTSAYEKIYNVEVPYEESQEKQSNAIYKRQLELSEAGIPFRQYAAQKGDIVEVEFDILAFNDRLEPFVRRKTIVRMNAETYKALSYGWPWTIEDYKQIGKVWSENGVLL